MHRADISRAMVRLIHCFLRKRTFKIKLEGQRSTTRTATTEVPQGSAISPVLFNIYTSDIPATAHVNLAMYTDDVCIFSSFLNARVIDQRLQTALNTLQDWYAKWRITVHREKSAAVPFSIGGRRIRKHGNPIELTFQGGIISWQQQVKYLGVTLDSRVNWGAHIHRVLDRGRQMSGTLYPLMVGLGKLDPSLKIRIYKTVDKMGHRCAHLHQETENVPEPDTAYGPQRSLIRKEHHHPTRRRSGAIPAIVGVPAIRS
ncbi:hypothetical protein Trydic_g17593 [Trypoxylus dichotomus]